MILWNEINLYKFFDLKNIVKLWERKGNELKIYIVLYYICYCVLWLILKGDKSIFFLGMLVYFF